MSLKSSLHKTALKVFIAASLTLVFIVGVGIPATLWGEEKPGIYDPALDVKAAITTALARAKKENKHVLLMFGANWCPWCHALHGLFQTDVTIKKYLDGHYLLILVDIGEKKEEPLNRDLMTLYRVDKLGFPSLVVLNTEGQLLSVQSSGILEKGRGHDPERVMGFLKAEAPVKK